jgi:Flp pilus assembly pilin Flp
MLSLAKSIAIGVWTDMGGASLLERIWKDKGGASLIEYSLLIGIIVAVSVTVVGLVATFVGGRWATLCSNLGITNCPT